MVKSSGPEASVLKQLAFNNLYDREDAIKPPTTGTFMSSERSSTNSDRLEESLASWFQSGSGVFHVSGKAGSGKSTLMKHVFSQPRTREYLEAWAGDQELLCAAFFFWAAGNDEQKSLTGLFRSILFIILRQNTRLISEIFSEDWEEGNFVPRALDYLTRPAVIEKAFQKLLRKTTNGGYRICLFIDGLDEYEAIDDAAYWDLADQLGNWADGSGGEVKLCVSSRPYKQFLDTFDPSQHAYRTQIHLHLLNKPDIKRHCQKTLSEMARKFPDISAQIEKESEYLVQEIADRAEGVFLWAVLVVRIIISEARRGGSHGRLKQKLEETPRDMDKLYAKMRGSLNRHEEQLSSRLLYAVLTNPFRNNLNALCLAWLIDKNAWKSRVPQGGKDSAIKAGIEAIKDVTNHLDIWTQGLIEVAESALGCPSSSDTFPSDSSSILDSPLFATRVKLFHRTARDYLLRSMQTSEIQSAFQGFSLSTLHADLRLAELAILNPIYACHSRHLYSYGYELLTAKSSMPLGLVGEKTAGFLATWPVVKELARILPSDFIVQTYEWLMALAPFKSTRVHISQHTHQHYLAASLGLKFNDVTDGFIRMESEPSPRNLLLSACLSGLYFGRSSSLDLVKSLLEKGFTAHEQVKILNSEREPLGESADQVATVWMILVSGLVSFDQDAIKVVELINILGELLHHESQEEVLLLGTNPAGEEYDCYITLEDLICKLDEKAHILDNLQGWPKYGEAGPESEHAPTWIWEHWRGQRTLPIARSMRKLTEDELTGVRPEAVVSRTCILELGKDMPPRFMLW